VTRSEHRYGGHRSQRAELTLPSAGGPFPVAALIHGGCFRQRYDRRLMDDLVADLAGRGWAAWNLEYRRLGRGADGGWPATFEDVAAGMDALAGLGAPLDLDRVVAIGHSAGGCLALWAGLRRDAAVPVAAAVGQAALADLAACARDGVCGEQVPALLGGGPDLVPERYAAASPLERLPLRCRTLVVHGLRDDVVPPEQSAAFADAAGPDCDWVALEGEAHMEHLDPGSACWRAVIQWL
jgi:acetyl esterase/lipase